jgi:hypothetical protein
LCVPPEGAPTLMDGELASDITTTNNTATVNNIPTASG